MGLNGVMNILKPPGMTSSDVVVYLRKKIGVKKVGHAGTLDPAATGVLMLCIGKGTKISDYIMEANKTYRGEMVLGIETDTLDAEGKIIGESTNYPSIDEIKACFGSYQGELLQRPPMYSARRFRGKRLHELARQGKTVEVEPRKIEITENKILEFYPPNRVFFEVACSKGTYIRSLVRDIGKDLGCGAYLSFLVRVSSGIFNINYSATLDEIKIALAQKKLKEYLIPLDEALVQFKKIKIKDSMFLKLVNGNTVKKNFAISDMENIAVGELLRIYCRNEFVGLGYINSNNMIQMRKVLI